MSDAFTLVQITEMAKGVRGWKEEDDSKLGYISFTGRIKPNWYSLDRLAIKVDRQTYQDANSQSGQNYKYTARVTYGKETIGYYQGDEVSDIFDIANKKIESKEVSRQKALAELRTLISNTPQEGSSVSPLSSDEVVGLIKRFDSCKYSERNRTASRYDGRINFDGKDSRILISRYYDKNNGKWFLKMDYKGETVLEGTEFKYHKILQELNDRVRDLDRVIQEREKKERIEKIKRAFSKKIAGEKK